MSIVTSLFIVIMLTVLLSTDFAYFAAATYPDTDEGESYDDIFVEGRQLCAKTRVWGAYNDPYSYNIGMWEFHTWASSNAEQAAGMVIEYWYGTGYGSYQFDVGTTYYTNWCEGGSCVVAGRTTQLWLVPMPWPFPDVTQSIDSGIAEVFVS